MTDDPTSAARRQTLRRLFALAGAPAAATTASLLAGCGGGGPGNDPIAIGLPPAPVPTPPPSPAPPSPAPTPAGDPLVRLKAALAASAPGAPTLALTVTQGPADSAASSYGATAQVFPPLPQSGTQSLAEAAQVWGWRRDLWSKIGGAVIGGQAVAPVSRDHPGSTGNAAPGICALHFQHTGQSFELLLAGPNVNVTLVVDGRYAASRQVTTALAAGVPGAPLANVNASVKFDFGSVATRKVSVWARSAQGPCALMVAAGDTVAAWDRSGEAAFAAMADSYGQASSAAWGVGGLFLEAAAQLGIPNVDVNGFGGTGYAPNSTNADTQDAGNAFVARLASSVDGLPDLIVTAGGINDDNAVASPPLYTTGDQAKASFDAAVSRYFTNLRAALPNAVLVALGPWAPVQSTPTDPVARSKADTIKAALQAAGGRWVFIDNLAGGWVNSAGASAAASGAWQTGTGNVGNPRGDGNGDQYVSADTVHPTEAGCLYLGQVRLAADLRAAITAL